jgi:hypothetical protein
MAKVTPCQRSTYFLSPSIRTNLTKDKKGGIEGTRGGYPGANVGNLSALNGGGFGGLLTNSQVKKAGGYEKVHPSWKSYLNETLSQKKVVGGNKKESDATRNLLGYMFVKNATSGVNMSKRSTNFLDREKEMSVNRRESSRVDLFRDQDRPLENQKFSMLLAGETSVGCNQNSGRPGLSNPGIKPRNVFRHDGDKLLGETGNSVTHLNQSRPKIGKRDTGKNLPGIINSIYTNEALKKESQSRKNKNSAFIEKFELSNCREDTTKVDHSHNKTQYSKSDRQMEKGLKSTTGKKLNSFRNMNEEDNNGEAIQIQRINSNNNLPRKNINTNLFFSYKESSSSPRQIYLKKQPSPVGTGASRDFPGRNGFSGAKNQNPENSKQSPKNYK